VALVAALVLGSCKQAPGNAGRSARVVSVADGDTITVLVTSGDDKRTEKIRLRGVDCPERAQPFGNKAKQLTSKLVSGKEVEIVPGKDGTDRYGRTIAEVRVDGRSLNEELLRAGLAWHYKQYDDSERYDALERAARAAKLGLWAEADPIPPWEWRKRARKGEEAPSSSPALPDAPFHGNVKSKVLHAPSCPHYHCKNCKARFGTVKAATAAGYRPHSCVKAQE